MVRQVHTLVKAAMREGKVEVAVLMAVARQFLLRGPQKESHLRGGVTFPCNRGAAEGSRAALSTLKLEGPSSPYYGTLL